LFLLVVHSFVALLGFHGSRGIASIENGSLSDSSNGLAGCRSLAAAGIGFCKSRVASMFPNPNGTRPLVAGAVPLLSGFEKDHQPLPAYTSSTLLY
jgi:hypothetical protein